MREICERDTLKIVIKMMKALFLLVIAGVEVQKHNRSGRYAEKWLGKQFDVIPVALACSSVKHLDFFGVIVQDEWRGDWELIHGFLSTASI